jgi:hypothetical protein
MQKIIPVETVPGIREEELEESDGGENSSMIYLIHCESLCKYYNVPPPSTAIKEEEPQGHMDGKHALYY